MSDSLSSDFLKLCARRGVLKFGEFTTKSGRLSPYFFNTGHFFTGQDINELGEYYASKMLSIWPEGIDVIYGPAYKGIPLAIASAGAMSKKGFSDTSYCFNRKEVKAHGDKGLLVGKVPEKGQSVVIVDDVVTAGTSLRESVEILRQIEGIELKGAIISLDRQERGMESPVSAVQELESDLGLKIYALAGLDNLLEILEQGELEDQGGATRKGILEYRDKWGVVSI